VLWCATSRRQHQIPREPTRVGTDFVQSARSVRDLGIYLDSDASMNAHSSVLLGSQPQIAPNDPYSCTWHPYWSRRSTLVPLMTSYLRAGKGGARYALDLVCEHVTKPALCEIMICR